MKNIPDMRTDLARAKGLGSSKSGLHHWQLQRISAVAMLSLTLWSLFFINSLLRHSHNLSDLIVFLQKPYNIVFLATFFITGLYHALLGIQVVLEDYVSCLALRMVAWISLKIFIFFTIAALVIALFYLAIT